MANLSKYITHGALVVASIGAALTLSEAAKAFTISDLQANPNLTVTLNDKIFSNFFVTGSTVEPTDVINIGYFPVGSVYQVNYDATPGTNFLTTSGSLTYKVSILPGFTNIFDQASTEAQGGPLQPNFTKTLSATGLSPNVLVYTGIPIIPGTFDPTPPGLKTIDVTSTWTPNPGSYVNSFSDKFTQQPPAPTPSTNVPEPSGVLGLVALGLVGLVSRTVSKSVGK